jgi:DnaD/phage-associated family protein
MNTDIRIQLDFLNHPKRKRLVRRVGSSDYIINIWLTAATTNPDGRLVEWTVYDIAEAAQWPHDRDPQELVNVLLECGGPGHAGFLEIVDGVYALHDWADHQPYVVRSPDRKERARRAAEARWDKEKPPQTVTQVSRGDATSIQNRCSEHQEPMPRTVPYLALPGNTSSNGRLQEDRSGSKEQPTNPPVAPQPRSVGMGEAYRLYQQEIGTLDTAMRLELAAWKPSWIAAAIKEAVLYNRRHWRYVAGVLRRWQTIDPGRNVE